MTTQNYPSTSNDTGNQGGNTNDLNPPGGPVTLPDRYGSGPNHHDDDYGSDGSKPVQHVPPNKCIGDSQFTCVHYKLNHDEGHMGDDGTSNPEYIPFRTLVVPQNVGKIEFTFSFSTTISTSLLSWQVTRDPAEDDYIKGSVPKWSLRNNNILQPDLETNAEGTFSLSLVCRDPEDGWLGPYVLAGINIIMLKATVDTQLEAVRTSKDYFNQIGDNHGSVTFLSYEMDGDGNPTQVPISFNGFVNVLGGQTSDKGQPRSDGLSSVDAGWFQDITMFSGSAGYENPPGTIQFDVFPSLKCLDVGRKSPPTVYNTKSTFNALPPSETSKPGAVYQVFSYDNPAFTISDVYLQPEHPPGGYAKSADFVTEFDNYIGYRTSDFPTTYAALGKIHWIIIFHFAHLPSQGWANTGCSVELPYGSLIDTSGCPSWADAPGIGATTDLSRGIPAYVATGFQ